MKVALVHELLTTRGGAERVLKILADMFPSAPIYTLLYDERTMGDLFPKERVRPSGLQPANWQLTFGNWQFNHHFLLRKFPAAVEAFDLSEFDLVISSSSAFAHGIITNGRPKHLCYVHSPARYLWDSTHEVLERASHGILGPLKRRYLEHAFHGLRIWDSEAAERPDMLLANSKAVQRRIELYWRRESDVLYPPVDDYWLELPIAIEKLPMGEWKHTGNSQLAAGNYYLIVSTLSPYKCIDLAIEACNALGQTLIIVGEGRDRLRLKRMAGPTIEFLGYRPNEEVCHLYRGAKAVLFPGEDDFGLVPLEAQACGTPVIAYRAGGAIETVIDGETGAFFTEPSAQSLIATIDRLSRMAIDPQACRNQARRFSTSAFCKGLAKVVKELMKEHMKP